MSFSVKYIAKVTMFLLLISWNNILLYDDVVSVDFRTYQYIWSNSGITLSPIEFLFRTIGSFLPYLDFRIFFSVLNIFLLFIISRHYSNGILLILLTSPFTVLGFGNTVLSFSAGLAWLAFAANFPKIGSIFAVLLHKAGMFLAVFTYPVLTIMLAFALFFGQNLIPAEVVATLKTFEEPLSEIIIKTTMCFFPLIFVVLIPKSLQLRTILEILSIAILVAAAYTISSKVADRIVYMIFFFGLYRADIFYKSISVQKIALLVYVILPINIILVFASGAKEHMPNF